MKLFELLDSNYQISGELNSEINSGLEILDEETFKYKNDSIFSEVTSHFLSIINIQKQSADNANHPTLGFDKLKASLNNISGDKIINMRMIESENWAGRVYSDNTNLIGLFLGKKRNKNWKTPPNWDGSIEMLEKYNKG